MMSRTLFTLLVAIIIVFSALGYFAYNYWLGTLPVFTTATNPADTIRTSLPTPVPVSDTNPIQYRVESFAQNLAVPWSMVFTSANRVLVTERPGRIRVLENGTLQANPLRTFPEVSSQAEEGLMGMTLDPEYGGNKYLYLCIAYEAANGPLNKVVRLTDEGTTLTQDTILLDNIPAAEFHAGCRLRFGPDGMLYITTGDARDPESAQDTSSLAGKFLRINADGSVPTTNPFPNSPVFSLGHRNPQGFDWHPVARTLVSTEHGPSGNDGPGGGDEVNLIEAGHNYGWPKVSHGKTQEGMDNPLLLFTPAVAPASGMFYRGTVFPQFTNHYFAGLLRGTGILHITFDDSGRQVVNYETLSGIEVGRVRDIVEGPDGFMYFTTSNTDGRGDSNAGDDQIFRLVPVE